MLRKFLEKQKPHFEKGGKLELFYPVFELIDTFIYTSGEVTHTAPHIRDGMDLKRMMIIVVIALFPAMFMAAYNTGLQANLAYDTGITPGGWRADLITAWGLGFDPGSIWGNIVHGLLYFLPVLVVTFLAGGFWEVLFSIVRKHDINEGFFVTGMLFPMIVPPTIPLWQVAIGISFGVVIGKEVFGGTGMNVFNPALIGRAFLFFNFPGEMSGNKVWVAAETLSAATPHGAASTDVFTMATPLGVAATDGLGAAGIQWWDAFWGFIPGSMGETSTFAILLGAALLIGTGIASWRVMVGVLAGMVVVSTLFNLIAPHVANPMFQITPAWHLVLGGFAFGTVFMATDPVSSAMTEPGKWIYGILIGVMVVLIRVVNQAFPEGMMLAILFGNAFAPLIDNLVVRRNIKRREAGYGL